MKTAFLLPALLSAALTLTLRAASPDELRAQAEQLIEKAKQAKSAGYGDEAQAMMERVKAIQGQLREQLASVGGPEGGDRTAEPARREAGQVRRQIEELRRAGKQDEAAQLERKFAEHDSPPGGDGPERLAHLLQAIEHLRAAGLNDPADSLSRLAEQMRAELERHGAPGDAPSPDRTQNALRELREAVMQMRGQMEKMQRQIEELRAPSAK